MKRKFVWFIFIFMTLVMFGCWGSDDSGKNEVYNGSPSGGSEEVNAPVLYAVGVDNPGKPAGPVLMTSSLYKIDAGTGAAMLIGNIGYYVNGIAYDSNKKKLFGITSNGLYAKPDVKESVSVDVKIEATSQLIEINMSSGEGKLIGDIYVQDADYKNETKGDKDKTNFFSSPTFNPSGTLYAWNISRNALCTIDLNDGEANCGDVNKEATIDVGLFDGLDNENLVLSFDNKGDLYILDGLKLFMLDNFFDDERIFLGTLNKNLRVYNGDFHPVTGQFWGLQGYGDVGVVIVGGSVKGGGGGDSQKLFVININDLTLYNSFDVMETLQAIAWVYDRF